MKRGTIDHPKTLLLAQLLDVEVWGAVGLLESLWHWTARYAIQGNIGKWSDTVIATGIGWHGRPGAELIGALVQAGWLDQSTEHRLVIHDIADHADNTWRQNLMDAGLGCFCNGKPARGSVGRPRKSRETPEKLQKLEFKCPQPEPEPEPLRERELRSLSVRTRAARATQWPAEFTLTLERADVARQLGVDAAGEWNKFRDHALKDGKTHKNWDAAWRYWCRQVPQFQRRTMA